jgi:hypothetical protein
MPLQLNTQSKQKQFLASGDRRAQHHAPNIAEIVPLVIRAVFDHADPGTVYGHLYDGKLTGSGWADFGGGVYGVVTTAHESRLNFARAIDLAVP